MGAEWAGTTATTSPFAGVDETPWLNPELRGAAPWRGDGSSSQRTILRFDFLTLWRLRAVDVDARLIERCYLHLCVSW